MAYQSLYQMLAINVLPEIKDVNAMNERMRLGNNEHTTSSAIRSNGPLQGQPGSKFISALYNMYNKRRCNKKMSFVKN